MSNRLPIIAAEIAAEHQAVTMAQGEFVRHAIAAGDRLLEAKELVSHGDWTDWLERNVPSVSIRTAQRYMRAAKRARKNDTVTFSTLKEIIEDKPTGDEIEDQVADLMLAWADCSNAEQHWFRDVVEIVGVDGQIPDHILRTPQKMIRDTARTLRKIRGRA